MVAFQTRLKQTVTLVENRVKDKSSDDPLKDLTFLSDHYRSRHEWDKANAATRHMLALAEGDVHSTFETTPLDIEFQQSRAALRRLSGNRVLKRFTVAFFVVVGIWYAALQLIATPQIMLDLKTQIFSTSDPQAFVDRAAFFQRKSQLKEALADCNAALKLDATNSNALQEKAFILFCMGKFQQALQVNERSNHRTTFYYGNVALIQAALGDDKAAAEASEMQNAMAQSPALLYSAAWSSANAGDYEKALRFAQLETITSKTDYDKAEGLSQEARYLLGLGRYQDALDAATKSINIGSKPLASRAFTYRAEAKYNLSQYAEAADDASKALNMDYTDYRAYSIRGKCSEMLGRTIDAQADFRNGDSWRNGRNI